MSTHHADTARNAIDALIRDSDDLAAIRGVLDRYRRWLPQPVAEHEANRMETDEEVVVRLALSDEAFAPRPELGGLPACVPYQPPPDWPQRLRDYAQIGNVLKGYSVVTNDDTPIATLLIARLFPPITEVGGG